MEARYNVAMVAGMEVGYNVAMVTGVEATCGLNIRRCCTSADLATATAD